MIQIQHFNQAIIDFNQVQVFFNNGNIQCFLFQNKWYPLRAFINHVSVLAGENLECTKDRALVKLHELVDYVKVEQVMIENNNLASLTTEVEKPIKLTTLFQ